MPGGGDSRRIHQRPSPDRRSSVRHEHDVDPEIGRVLARAREGCRAVAVDAVGAVTPVLEPNEGSARGGPGEIVLADRVAADGGAMGGHIGGVGGDRHRVGEEHLRPARGDLPGVQIHAA
ncbi:MAG: hypothetical protein AVDCRST_MAG48-3584 [uncultured Friedmanniella sp.]|uniref:Uncharacterized protein n=1 Tax=uncultured Friedmanniella sp. TaxID=335381 RepID=A0A6J4LS78_9ACTN|nr:MAG: hypothetical protein AVDCRST_MAG48-3584 [uncultured Friedmanniella sp.]